MNIPYTFIPNNDIKEFENLYLIKEETRDCLLSLNPHDFKNKKYMWVMWEAVISVDYYKNKIIKIFKDNKGLLLTKYNYLTLDELYSYFNDIFENNKIIFKSSGITGNEFISSGSTDKETFEITIRCNTNSINILKSSKDFDLFINQSIKMIGHELVHREQMFYVSNLSLRKKLFQQNKFIDINSSRKYLSKKYEIMSYAWQIIESMRLQSTDDKDIKKLLIDSSQKKFSYNPLLLWYHQVFDINDEPLKRLYKYMYQYLE